MDDEVATSIADHPCEKRPVYPLPEQINPEIHEAITNPNIWVVPSSSSAVGRSTLRQRTPAQPSFREVFLCRRNNARHAYDIIKPPAFQPIELSHGGKDNCYCFCPPFFCLFFTVRLFLVVACEDLSTHHTYR